MSICINGKAYWVRLFHNGKRTRESTGTADKIEALRFHELKAKLWEKPLMGKTWEDACVDWLQQIAYPGLRLAE